MVSSLKEFIKIISLGPRAYAVILVFTLLFLFLPQSTMNVLGLSGAQEEWRWLAGIGALLSVSGLAAFLFPTMLDKIGGRLRQKAETEKRQKHKIAKVAQRQKHIVDALNGISAYEQAILAECLVNNTRTHNLPLNYAPANSLVQKGLLIRGNGVGYPSSWPFTIPIDAWDYIKNHPEKIGCSLKSEENKDEQEM